MKHATWNTLNDLIDHIVEQYGGSIYDYRAGKSWDPGQAVCAELYGPDWFHTPEFRHDDESPESEPAPVGAIEAAERVLAGECDWMKGPVES